MPNNFDEVVAQRSADAVKHSPKNNMPGVIPMWIADMDFKTPEVVREAILSTIQQGVFGYTDPNESYEKAVCGWYKRNFNWDVKPAWNVRSVGVVFSIAAAIRALTDEGDTVLIQQPVYYPFMEIIKKNNRKLAVNELRLNNGKYDIDFADFELKIKESKAKLFILCSPHNPVGRVWSKEELSALGDICLRYGVHVVSDEIHADLVYSGHSHTVFASLSADLSERTITCTAPTKTFNLAGLQTANIFISDEKLRSVYIHEHEKTGCFYLNMVGLAATKAAYTYGQSWLDELIPYLESNISFLKKSLEETDGAITLIQPEGTYLMWLDCRNLSLSDSELNRFFIDKAKVKLHKGVTFGESGSGFARMNIACPRATLEQAVNQIVKAVKEGFSS